MSRTVARWGDLLRRGLDVWIATALVAVGGIPLLGDLYASVEAFWLSLSLRVAVLFVVGPLLFGVMLVHAHGIDIGLPELLHRGRRLNVLLKWLLYRQGVALALVVAVIAFMAFAIGETTGSETTKQLSPHVAAHFHVVTSVVLAMSAVATPPTLGVPALLLLTPMDLGDVQDVAGTIGQMNHLVGQVALSLLSLLLVALVLNLALSGLYVNTAVAMMSPFAATLVQAVIGQDRVVQFEAFGPAKAGMS